MTPLQCYKEKIAQGLIQADPLQEAIILQLQSLFEDIVAQTRPSLLKRLVSPFSTSAKRVKGAYLHGEVGVGKTFLLDTFYQSLPVPKLRFHFHQFMQMVHEQLKIHKGKKRPLRYVAEFLANQTKVICFDEFIVDDIADAMLLGGLLQELFAKNIYLVATSNSAPDKLYLKGLQREQFLPAIDLIKNHLQVSFLDAHRDYRLTGTKISQRYWMPSDRNAKAEMKKMFVALSRNATFSQEPIIIDGRHISVMLRSEHIIWFDFMSICGVPRSTRDYLLLTKPYPTIFISDVPVIEPYQKDLAKAFIQLIDVLYDAKVLLVIAANAAPAKLYPAGPFHDEFNRACSRLIEMQSDKWLTD